MPINFLATVYVEGRQTIPYYDYLKYLVPGAAITYGLKSYFAGPRNTWEKDLHGKVFLITGGTSGLGAETVRNLAQRGAQVILLVKNIQDGWLLDNIDDLREATSNPCVYAEECDLSDLYSVRKFATKWIDNMPARRLDGVICCASLILPPGTPRRMTNPDGLEPQYEVTYLSHYLLLNILAPAIKAQPPDREVRIILTSCISSVMAELDLDDLGYIKRNYPVNKPFLVNGEAKLSLALMGYELQRQFDSHERKDGAPSNVHVSIVDPGMMRSPSFKRFITFGRLWMILIYLILWPIWWLLLKSSVDGCQSMLFAIMNPDTIEQKTTAYISNVGVRDAPPRSEFSDIEKQKELFERTAKLIEAVEKRTAVQRNQDKPKESKSKAESSTRTQPKKTKKSSKN